MKLKYQHNLYWLKTSFENRQKAMSAGFKWNKAKRLFWTEDPEKAKEFLMYAVDQETVQHLTKALDQIHYRIQQSEATGSNITVPKPDGLEYFSYQKAGIEFTLARGNALIADQMGLGKTLEAIGVVNYLLPKSVLIICPASVKINWQRELEKWLVDYYPVGIAYGNRPFPTDPL